MIEALARQTQLEAVLIHVQLPPDIQVRCWTEADLSAIQRLSDLQGWPTHHSPEELIASWSNSWPALVAVKGERVVGYVRGLTDQYVLLQITDLIVDANERKQGIGRLLLAICHLLYPRTLMSLVAEPAAIPFYKNIGFQGGSESYKRVFQKSDSTT